VLIIRRRAGETLVVDGGIEIQVLEIGANRVKLGIVAPPQVNVVRKEVARARAQTQAAANPAARGLESLARGLRQSGREGA
jgi:carbon storage regulator